MGNSNQSNLENVERIRDKRGWSGYFGVEGKQHVLLRLCTSTPMKTARIRGGAAYLSSWPRSAQHGRTQKFPGGRGEIVLILMWNTANIFLELKLRDLVHIRGYFFHLNDYETKIHYFKNFGGGGGGGTRAPAPPPPCVRPCCPKKSCTLHFISPAPHTITHLVDPHGHNTESTRESYNASLINAINVHSCINC